MKQSNIIGRKIIEVRYESFKIKKNIISKIISVYLLLDNNTWYRIFSSDGYSWIKEIKKEPCLTKNDIQNNDFEYPINNSKIYLLDTFGVVEKVEEYLWQGRNDESGGFLIFFSSGMKMKIFDQEDSLSVITSELIKPVKGFEMKDAFSPASPSL